MFLKHTEIFFHIFLSLNVSFLHQDDSLRSKNVSSLSAYIFFITSWIPNKRCMKFSKCFDFNSNLPLSFVFLFSCFPDLTMTVQYIQHMHSSKAFLFLRLLFRWAYRGSKLRNFPPKFSLLLNRWRGGMIKIVWLEMIILSVLYITVSLVYRLALTKEMQR